MFDKNFLWGTASSSYQIEGAFAEDGKEGAFLSGIHFLISQAISHTTRMVTKPATTITAIVKILYL